MLRSNLLVAQVGYKWLALCLSLTGHLTLPPLCLGCESASLLCWCSQDVMWSFRSFLCCLLPAKALCLAVMDWCQCSTAKLHLPWCLVKVSLLPMCVSPEQLPWWGEGKGCHSVSQLNEVPGFTWFLFLSAWIFPSVYSRRNETTFFSFPLKPLKQPLSFREMPSIALKT